MKRRRDSAGWNPLKTLGKCCWKRLLFLTLLLTSSPIGYCQAKKRSDYLYRDLPDGGGDPIVDFYNPPGASPNNRPDFLYQEDFPHHRVVEFYSPLCPHCVRFAPHYVEFAKHFHKLSQRKKATRWNHYAAGMQVQFYAVSCMASRPICKDQGIKGYPTVKVYPKGTTKGIFMQYFELHPMSLVKTLGIATVDDNTIDQEEEDSKATTTTTETVQATAENNDSNNKPAFMARRPTEIFADAYLSFHTAMKTAVFIDSGGKLGKEKEQVLNQFIQTLHRVLPPWSIHAILEKLLGGSKRNFVANEAAFQTILEAHPPKTTEYSAACQLHESPYTCGLWTLFHILTVGVVEFNSAIVNPNASQNVLLNNEVVSKLIRDFVQHFLLCEVCTQHFLEEYDACSYDRCKRLSKKKHSPGTPEDWKELPLWLLETHNGVNLRLKEERLGTALTVGQQQQVMWPPIDDCPSCWFEMGGATTAARYNHTMMYNYMRLVYWPEDHESAATREELNRPGALVPTGGSPKEVGVESRSRIEVNKGGSKTLFTHSGATATGTKRINNSDRPFNDKMSVISKEVQYALIVMAILVVLVWNKRRIRWCLTPRKPGSSLK